MTDTPETDAAIITKIGQFSTAVVDVEFARALERQRDKAREALRLASQKAQMQAAVFKSEDLRDNSRWSIFNEGRAQALEKFAEELEEQT